MLEADYATAFDEASSCDPNAVVEPCTERVVEGLACSCGAFVNPEHEDALARAFDAQSAYQAERCSEGIVCGACLEPVRGQCSAAGRCENVYGLGGRGCKVDGRTYADGDDNIPDPVSCNSCTCSDGELACTKINCPEPCADGTALGTQCAECGPTDACQVVEHACFPTCVDTCGGEGFCLAGVCISSLCG